MKKSFILTLALVCIGISGCDLSGNKKDSTHSLSKPSQETQALAHGFSLTLTQIIAEMDAIRIKLQTLSATTPYIKSQIELLKKQSSDIQNQILSLQSELHLIQSDPIRSQRQMEIETIRQQLKILQSNVQIIKKELRELKIEETPSS